MNTEVMFSRNSDEWPTPKAFFDSLNAEFHFTLDPCATDENHKCDKYFTQETDGLKQDWGGPSRFLQPTIWYCNRQVGGEMLQGKPKGKYFGGYAYSSKNRYEVFPRLHIA